MLSIKNKFNILIEKRTDLFCYEFFHYNNVYRLQCFVLKTTFTALQQYIFCNRQIMCALKIGRFCNLSLKYLVIFFLFCYFFSKNVKMRFVLLWHHWNWNWKTKLLYFCKGKQEPNTIKNSKLLENYAEIFYYSWLVTCK